MFCHKCGKENSGGSKFCYNCGTSLEINLEQNAITANTESKNEKSAKNQSNKKRLVISAFSIVICVIAGYFSFFKTTITSIDIKNARVSDLVIFFKTTMTSTDIKNARVGDLVIFGNYKNSPIEWRVLSVDGYDKLLISETVLEFKPYSHYENAGNTYWSNSTLRKWLNSNFYREAFTCSEQYSILTTYTITPDNNVYGSEGGESTYDKVFCLSIEEVNKYFPLSERRICKISNYCMQIIDEKLRNTDKFGYRIYDIYDLLDVNSGNCRWWLRSPGHDNGKKAVITPNGDVGLHGCSHCLNLCVRPAIWVSINKI